MIMVSSISISISKPMPIFKPMSKGLHFHSSSNSRVMMMASSQPPPQHHNTLMQPQQQDIVRPLVHFPEKISGDFVMTSFTEPDQNVYKGYEKEIQSLKEEALKMILKECKAVDKLYLIDTIERLGLSYHFEDEIEGQLELLFNGGSSSSTTATTDGDADSVDLSAVALQFRLFRQHGYPISSDVFEQFTYGNGKFKKSLQSDTKGLLNLYEAAYVRTRKDIILDEALSFTRNNLLKKQSESAYIDKLVKHALHQSLHRGLPILESRHFIGAYELDEMHNPLLLRLAKLDFNLLQLMYKQELSESIRWWNELDVVSKIPHVRDRLVESYLLAVGMLFEPKYSAARLLGTKYLASGTFIDDSYDLYATIDELPVLTDAIQRWNVGEGDGLPEYMKNAYNAFIKMNEEFEKYATELGRPYAYDYVKESWKEWARCSNIQCRWFMSKDLPSYDEYMVTASVTCAAKLNSYVFIMGMDSATEDVFKWISKVPPILKAINIIMRVVNDVSGNQVDKQTGNATPVDIYMKTFNVSEEEAKRKMIEMIEDAWKDLNEEYCRKQTKPITREIWTLMINETRCMDVYYKNYIDSWKDPQNELKPLVNQMFKDPFTI